MSILPYVYNNNEHHQTLLSQGDVLKVEGKFLSLFRDFYPKVNTSEKDDKFCMIISQSCDLVKHQKRQPKLDHITVCLVRPLIDHLNRYINNTLKPSIVKNIKLLDKDSYEKFEDRIYKLLNNSENKTYFYLPQKNPLPSDMVAILTLPYPFRLEHYDTLLENKILSLKSSFQAKIGDMLSTLYGRVATPDLSESGIMDVDISRYIEKIITNLQLKAMPDRSYIEYISKNSSDTSPTHLSIEELATKFQDKVRQEKFAPERKALTKTVRDKLFAIFSDQTLCNHFLTLNENMLRKEIAAII